MKSWEHRFAMWLAALATAAITAGVTQIVQLSIRQAVVEQRLDMMEQTLGMLQMTALEISQSQKDVLTTIRSMERPKGKRK